MMKDFVRGKDGLPLANNSDNIRFFFKGLGIELRWNGWIEQIEIRGGNSFNPTMCWPEWMNLTDVTISRLITHAHRSHTDFRISKEFIWHTVTSMAHANIYDPVVERLDQLENEWDGEGRLESWLIKACKLADTPYHRAVGRLLIGGMVMRARHAGCKFDLMPVLTGPQGHGKSTMLAIIAALGTCSLPEILAGRGQWFTDSVLLGTEAKELILALAGVLVAEVSEMGERSTAGANAIKAMVSRTADRGRVAYGRVASDRARRNIFVGTTNDEKPLSDPTGNRRFLPIHIASEIDLEWLSANIGQIVGEAAAAESAGEVFALSRELWTEAAAAQDAVTSTPDWQIALQEWCGQAPADALITANDLRELAKAAAAPRAISNRQYKPYMEKLGYRTSSQWVGGRSASVYLRGDKDKAARIVPDYRASGRVGVRYDTNVNGQTDDPIKRMFPLPPMPPQPVRA